MLNNLKEEKIWAIDWSKITHKNWAEKERKTFESKHKEEYELFSRKLEWFQKKKIKELLDQGDMEKIGSNKGGYKINFRIISKTIRILGYLTENHKIFYPLLFIYKKTKKILKSDLENFENRLKKL